MTVHVLLEDCSFMAPTRVVSVYRDLETANSMLDYMTRTSAGTSFSYRVVTMEVK